MSDERLWPALDLASMTAAWDASPTLIVLTVGPDHRVAYQNPASRALFGPRPTGVPVTTAFPELSERARATLDSVLQGGGAVTEELPRPGVLGQSGERVLLTYVFAPVGEPGRTPAGVLLTAIDVTAEATASRASAQSAVLSELSDRMNAADQPDRALQQLTRTLVPAVADLAAVFVIPSAESSSPWVAPRAAATAATAGTPSATARAGSAGRPQAPSRIVALDISPELLEAVGLPPQNTRDGRPSPWQPELAAGRPVLIDIAGGDLAGRSDPAVMTWLESAAAHTMAVLPLTVGGQLAGAVVLLATGSRAAYEPGDLPFLELAAARAGAAVSHVRLFRQQREIALDLQHSLLPRVPDDVPDLDVAVRFLAGGADVDIGGDWWDVHHIGAAGTAVGLGDVAGRGVHAAVIMGQARSAMRAASLAGLDPVEVLALLDRQLAGVLDAPVRLGTAPPPTFATAVYAVVDTEQQRLRVANAGHPPLILRRPDGSVSRVHAPPGCPLGLGLDGYRELTVPFPAGSVVVGFTDGLVESRATGIEVGLRSVEDFLREVPATCDIEELADGVLQAARRQHDLEDDVALVAVRSAG